MNHHHDAITLALALAPQPALNPHPQECALDPEPSLLNPHLRLQPRKTLLRWNHPPQLPLPTPTSHPIKTFLQLLHLHPVPPSPPKWTAHPLHPPNPHQPNHPNHHPIKQKPPLPLQPPLTKRSLMTQRPWTWIQTQKWPSCGRWWVLPLSRARRIRKCPAIMSMGSGRRRRRSIDSTWIVLAVLTGPWVPAGEFSLMECGGGKEGEEDFSSWNW